MTQKKLKFSEHISSIGSKEQNLDIPKLESSQAPEANEPIATCGAVVQDASRTSATAAQGLKNQGKCMIRVSSEQSGVPGVSWTWHNKLGSWQVFWFEEKNMKKKYFHVRDFMKTSKIFCEAKDDALRAAIEFRKDLERRGIAKAQQEITCYVASGPPPTSSPTPGLARVLEEAEPGRCLDIIRSHFGSSPFCQT